MITETFKRTQFLDLPRQGGPTQTTVGADFKSAPTPRPHIQTPPWLGQAVRYSAVGVLNTGLDAVLYLLLTHWLGLAGLRILAKGVSYGISAVNSYHWNRSWTFRSSSKALSTFGWFLLASLVAMGINTGAMYLFLDLLRQYEIPSLLMATGITLLWNFCANKFFVFKR